MEQNEAENDVARPFDTVVASAAVMCDPVL